MAKKKREEETLRRRGERRLEKKIESDRGCSNSNNNSRCNNVQKETAKMAEFASEKGSDQAREERKKQESGLSRLPCCYSVIQ